MATGTTLITILHPRQDIAMPTLGTSNVSVGQVVAAIERVLNGVAIGSAQPGTRVQVTQGAAMATGFVTLSGVGGAAATGSLGFSAASGTTTATVNGVAFSQTTGTDTQRATQLAGQIAASTNPAILGVLTAEQVGDDVEITAVDKGLAGNAITLAVTGTGLARSGATLTGGLDGSVEVTIDGVSAVATDTTNMTDEEAATAVAAALNGNASVAALVTAVGASNRVNLTAVEYGTSGNLIGLFSISDTGTATRSGATLTGGANGTSSYLERP